MVYGKTLTIQPIGLSADTSSAVIPIEGNVANAEIGDLNIDGFPEVLVYTQSTGSGSYGSVIGYSVHQWKIDEPNCFPQYRGNQKPTTAIWGTMNLPLSKAPSCSGSLSISREGFTI